MYINFLFDEDESVEDNGDENGQSGTTTTDEDYSSQDPEYEEKAHKAVSVGVVRIVEPGARHPDRPKRIIQTGGKID